MDREDNIYRKNLNELDLTGLGELCANVARKVFANSKQSDTAHALRMEWVRLSLDRLTNGDKTEAKESSPAFSTPCSETNRFGTQKGQFPIIVNSITCGAAREGVFGTQARLDDVEAQAV
jgi:hypothetical protein